MSIPVLDLFAGPGGLGEGFAAYSTPAGKLPFGLRLSVEMDRTAHRTLELRSFFRKFDTARVPGHYYAYLRREISREDLMDAYPEEASAASREALCAELGRDDALVDARIEEVLPNAGEQPWVLIGGPPCQAYSLVGRARRSRESRAEFEKDEKHFLYQQYLRVIARHRPAVFVMENVKGILSSHIDGQPLFRQILNDLAEPGLASEPSGMVKSSNLRYRIYSLVAPSDDSASLSPSDFIIMSENYGIPQTRHRVILLGVLEDLKARPEALRAVTARVVAQDVIGDLPSLRSTLSREPDSWEAWRDAVSSVREQGWWYQIPEDVRVAMDASIPATDAELGSGGEYVTCAAKCEYRADWYCDPRLGGVCNHSARGHMRSDLHRYLFAACHAQVREATPLMKHFPKGLQPNHRNVAEAVNGDTFADRFRVQLRETPGTTVTSHIAKDGHYFIHYDPSQCRSLTVREAARIQTFPDNYFFEGGRTAQYKQVGNAVPPLLAYQIAGVVYRLLNPVESYADDRSPEPRAAELEHVAHQVEEHPRRNGGAPPAAQAGLPVPPALEEAAGST